MNVEESTPVEELVFKPNSENLVSEHTLEKPLKVTDCNNITALLNNGSIYIYKTLEVNEPSYQAFFQTDHSRLNKPSKQSIIIPICKNGRFTAIFTTPSMKQGEFGFINNYSSSRQYDEQQAMDLITAFWKSHNIEHFDQFSILQYTSSQLNNETESGYLMLAIIFAIHQNSLMSKDFSKEQVIRLFSNLINMFTSDPTKNEAPQKILV